MFLILLIRLSFLNWVSFSTPHIITTGSWFLCGLCVRVLPWRRRVFFFFPPPTFFSFRERHHSYSIYDFFVNMVCLYVFPSLSSSLFVYSLLLASWWGLVIQSGLSLITNYMYFTSKHPKGIENNWKPIQYSTLLIYRFNKKKKKKSSIIDDHGYLSLRSRTWNLLYSDHDEDSKVYLFRSLKPAWLSSLFPRFPNVHGSKQKNRSVTLNRLTPHVVGFLCRREKDETSHFHSRITKSVSTIAELV